MFVPNPHRLMTEKTDLRPAVHIPIVYEQVSPSPARWEYYVMKLDPREEELPTAVELNALGQEGWILVGMLDERAAGKSAYVYYYFVRQQA
jgi:hypothetical protein